MKNLRLILGVGMIFAVGLVPLNVLALVENPPLVLRQIRMTGDEYIVLQATTDITESERYWLGYSSSKTGDAIPLQQLPHIIGGLQAGEAILFHDEAVPTCDAVVAVKLTPTLSDTEGRLVVWYQTIDQQTQTITYSPVDSVVWSKTATGSTQTAIDTNKAPAPTWYQNPMRPMDSIWRAGTQEGCSLKLSPLAGSNEDLEPIEWAQANEPPAIIENINEVEATPEENAIPGDNAGLAPPLITELLPNPAGTGTDGTDEYVELYNSNDAPFYLSGFTIQTGLTTKHSYLLPSGVSIAPKSFRVFYASQTNLSMSNTSGQATLLDGAGSIVAQSDPYDSAPDGQAWALANGTWYWTTKPTLEATNIIAQPVKLPATGIKPVAKTSASSAKVKASSTKTSKTSSTKPKDTATTPVKQASTVPKPTAIHPGVLALVGSGALGYGAYVYRKDLANAFSKLRRH